MFSYDPTQWGIDKDKFFAERKEYGAADQDSWNLDAFLVFFAYKICQALTDETVITLDPVKHAPTLSEAKHFMQVVENLAETRDVEFDIMIRTSLVQGFYKTILINLFQHPDYIVHEDSNPETPTYSREQNGFSANDLKTIAPWVLQVTAKGFDYILLFDKTNSLPGEPSFNGRLTEQKKVLEDFVTHTDDSPSSYANDETRRQNFLDFLTTEFNRLWS